MPGELYTSGTGITGGSLDLSIVQAQRDSLRTERTGIYFVHPFVSQDSPDLVGQLLSHLLSTAVYGDAVDDSLGAGKVNKLKNVRCVSPSLNNLAEAWRFPFF